MPKVKLKIEVGDKFSHLVVVEPLGQDRYKNQLFKCKCSCGQEKVVRASSLAAKNTRSCGCQRRKKIQEDAGRYKKELLEEELIKFKELINSDYSLAQLADKFHLTLPATRKYWTTLKRKSN